MVECRSCGFFEPHGEWPKGVCVAYLAKTALLDDVTRDIACKKFIERRRGWKLWNYHEWRDRYVSMKRTKWMAMVSLCISIVAVIVSGFYPTYLAQQRYEASLRADLSFLNNQAHWGIGLDYCEFNVTARIRNEGTRATDVKRVEITLNMNNGSDEIVFWNAKEPLLLGWSNSTILEKEIRDFSITITVVYSGYGFLPYQKPAKGSIKISHNDGISPLEEVRNFEFGQESSST